MPGEAVNQLLSKWADEKVETPIEFNNFVMGLWKSKERFERELRQEELGLHMEQKLFKNEYLNRTRSIRNSASFRIDALESALIETKIKCQLEVDRMSMVMAEIESTYLN